MINKLKFKISNLLLRLKRRLSTLLLILAFKIVPVHVAELTGNEGYFTCRLKPKSNILFIDASHTKVPHRESFTIWERESRPSPWNKYMTEESAKKMAIEAGLYEEKE